MTRWIRWMALALLIALFPAATLGIVMALLGHPYFLILCLVLLLLWPLIRVVRRPQTAR